MARRYPGRLHDVIFFYGRSDARHLEYSIYCRIEQEYVEFALLRRWNLKQVGAFDLPVYLTGPALIAAKGILTYEFMGSSRVTGDTAGNEDGAN